MADDPTLDPALATDPAPEPEPFTLPEDFANQVQEWDIPLDALPEAAKQYKALQTEEGVIDAFIATGQSLGFGLKDLNRLFEDEAPPAPAAPAAPAPAGEPEDPDRWMTAAEVTKMVAEIREEQAQAQLEQQTQQFQAKQQQTFQVIGQWYDQNDIKDDAAQRAIASFGERHIAPGSDSYDPRVALAALEAGKADYEAWLDREAQSYLAKKAGQAAGQPTPLAGGQTFSGEGGEEKVDYASLGRGALDAARERVRARLRAAGELD